MKDSLNALRMRIDEIDGKLAALFAERLKCSEQAAEIKRAANAPVLDETREQQVIARAAALVGEDMRDEMIQLMRTVLALSRERQYKLLNQERN